MGGVRTLPSRRMVALGVPASAAVAETSTPSQGPLERLRQWENLEAGKLGFTPALWSLLRQEGVTDVVISGTECWADLGDGLKRVDLELRNEKETRRLAVAMAAAAQRRLDDAQPIVDAVLPGPVRLHAVLPPLARRGTAISLRVLRQRPFSLSELVNRGAFQPAVKELLIQAVEKGTSLLIVGATGAGKTTLLSSLLGEVSPSERILVIEEVTEIESAHPHLVSLQARPPNIEGQGGIGLEELVRAAVRMRPDRLILGECRGPEVREVLTALNTGHAGGMTTIHANSIEDVPIRLQALGMLAGMEREAVGLMASSAFQLVVHMKRLSDGRRIIDSLGELVLQDGELRGRVTQRTDAEFQLSETRG